MNYEYKCPCGNLFDTQHRMGTAPEKCPCPKCGKEAVRTFSNAGWVLKGPGDHWPSRQLRVKQQGEQRSKEVESRMRRNHEPVKSFNT